MPDRISIHQPLLVNTIGHCTGAVVFGILVYLFLVNARRTGDRRSRLAAVAAALALAWNVGSLFALATGAAPNSDATNVVVAVSFSVLSLLPAVLLHISLLGRRPTLCKAGYVLSGVAIVLHFCDLLTGAPRYHYAALLLITFGFSGLTAVSIALDWQGSRPSISASGRLATAMCLFLFAISFVHFGTGEAHHAWSSEVAWHHAGLPLALLVLLQDYRFLLLDVFLRFLLNAILAASAVLTGVFAETQFHLIARSRGRPVMMGLLFVAACLLLALWSRLRNVGQKLLTRILFLRENVGESVAAIRKMAQSATSESVYLESAARAIADFGGTEQFALQVELPPQVPEPFFASPASGGWWQAIVPLRLPTGDAHYVLLGPRRGGRLYLSEDFEALSRLAAAVVEEVGRLRSVELQHLASKAELRALQAQINPHFLFNSLNTLYGIVSRNNVEARRFVLNLADVFRYFLRTDKALIRVADELKIVRAYLEIEEARLGPKLRTQIDADETALAAEVPALSIQPLVENAIKHGAAAQPGGGFVHISVSADAHSLRAEVSNSGAYRDGADSRGFGIGLSNVRRRLELCYGPDASLEVVSDNDRTMVSFTVPMRSVANLVQAPGGIR
jgi:two-component system LytT family sensor kinase